LVTTTRKGEENAEKNWINHPIFCFPPCPCESGGSKRKLSIEPSTNAIRSPERIAHIQKSTPVVRLAEQEEISNAIIFLASRKASYVTGITMDVNGGATMI